MPVLILALILLLSGCAPGAVLPAISSDTGAGMVLTAIDVGQGDAWFVQAATVKVLVDTGTDGAAARWLRRNGHRHVDLLVLTHPHLDHIGGAVDVLRRVRVGQVWMMTYDDDGPVARRVRHTAEQRRVPLAAPPIFHTVTLGPMRIEVLNPPPGQTFRGTDSEWNNESIVLRIVTEDGTVLLLGDTEREAHGRLLRSGIDLRADVIAVPHHGSSTTDLRLFDAVGAHTAVISVGADNPYGHPHREILAELSARQTRIVRTDMHGTVRVVVSQAPTSAQPRRGLLRSAA